MRISDHRHRATSDSSPAPASPRSATTCVCVDVDASQGRSHQPRRAPIHEPGLDELLRRTSARGLRATTDLRAAVLRPT